MISIRCKMKKLSLLLLVVIVNGCLYAQNLDSLKQVIQNTPVGYYQARDKLLAANLQVNSRVDSAMVYAQSAVEVLSEFSGDTVFALLSDGYNTLGICESNLGNYHQAIEQFFRSLEYDKKLGALDRVAKKYVNIAIIHKNQGAHFDALQLYDSSLVQARAMHDSSFIAAILLNKGVLYYELGNYEAALSFYTQSEALLERLKEPENSAILQYNIGLIFHDQGDSDMATMHYEKSRVLFEQLQNDYGVAYCYTSLGDVKRGQNAFGAAIDYYNQAFRIHENLGNKQGMAESLMQMGHVYFANEKYRKASDFFHEALLLNQAIDYPKGQAVAYRNLAHVLVQTNKLEKAHLFLVRSFTIAKQLEDIALLRDIHKDLSEIFELTGMPEKAYNHYKAFVQFRDTLETHELDASMTRLKARHDIESREKTIENLKITQEVQLEENKRQRMIIYFSFMMLVIVAAFVFMLYRKNHIIRNKNKALQLQQEEITSSIAYASKIQAAVLPPLELFMKIFPESFVFFKPRDLVSGDFYWTATTGNLTAIAAVDCTGHGVPGAFMSMMGISFLNELFSGHLDKSAGSLLSELRKHVKEALHQTNGRDDTKDGMDIALVIVNRNERALQFAGAYSPMVLIQNQHEVFVKGDRMPIGVHYNEKALFSTHQLSYNPGDMLYLFSDGYADQFGGTYGRKFRMTPFRELLKTLALLPVHTQKQILTQELNKWQGDMEQIDDILVMGVRLS